MMNLRLAFGTCTALAIFASASSEAHACMPLSIDFRYGSARLDGDANEIFPYLLEEFRQTDNGRVELIAQSDGSPGNVRMARRRAQVIREALIRRGVPAIHISTDIRRASGHVISGENPARRVVLVVRSAAEYCT